MSGGIQTTLFCFVVALALGGCGLPVNAVQTQSGANVDGTWTVANESCAGHPVTLSTGAIFVFSGTAGTYQYQTNGACTVTKQLAISYPRTGTVGIGYLGTVPTCSPVGCSTDCNVPAPTFTTLQDYTLTASQLTLRRTNTLCTDSAEQGLDIQSLQKQ